ncbi:hypothetical protein O181_125277 [Austropuccinia psidii MF-1]|uniref:Paired domain-containing protein n=1 Tax=Austropuccinia psidii MF-1 TaxID=1389203 RepID=A0A9Q3Q7A6_9BASI|nr:hypothetical protein [Austropuccinia psidii MF-1]
MRGTQCPALISYPVMSALPTPYKRIKPPLGGWCAPMTSSPPDIMPYLNVEMRGRIVGMRQAGLPFQAISNLAGVPFTTVYNTMKKYKRFGTVQTKKKTGHPPIMTAQDRRELNLIIT